VVFSLSVAVAFSALYFLYGQAWQIPGLRELRGNTLRFTLWLLASPLVGLAVGWARRATWPAAARACTICIVAGVPVTLLGGAIHRLRASSGESAVYCNLGALAAAADQYWMENDPTAEIRYEDLVGPSRYVKAVNPIVGEDYRPNFPLRKGDHLRAKLPNGRSVFYESSYLRADARNGDEESPHDAEMTSRKRFGAPTKVANKSVAGPESSATPLTATERKERREALCASCHARR
jgi:hypothetical protein